MAGHNKELQTQLNSEKEWRRMNMEIKITIQWWIIYLFPQGVIFTIGEKLNSLEHGKAKDYNELLQSGLFGIDRC